MKNQDDSFRTYRGDEPYIFVSYSKKNKDQIFPELRKRSNQGYRLWYDGDIKPGKDYVESLARAIKYCNFFIVFISKDSVISEFVKNEIHFALKYNKPFLAIHIEETQLPDDIKLLVGRKQAIYKYLLGEQDYERRMSQILPSITNKHENYNFKDKNQARAIEFKDRARANVVEWTKKYRMGREQWNWHDLGKAMKNIVISIHYFPKHKHTWTNLAYLHHIIGNPEMIEYCLTKSAELFDKSENNFKVKKAIEKDSTISGLTIERPKKTPKWFSKVFDDCFSPEDFEYLVTEYE